MIRLPHTIIELVREGWKASRTRKGHWRLTHSDASNPVIIGLSGDPQGQKNARTALRRALRTAKLITDEKASVTILGAVSFSSLVAICGLAVEPAYLAAVQLRMQRIADVSAFAGALAIRSPTTATSKAAPQAIALATLNGVSSDRVSVQIVTGIRNASHHAVQVTVTRAADSLAFIGFLGIEVKPISATAVAEVMPNADPAMSGSVRLVE